MALPKLSEHWQVNKSLVESNQYLLENGFGDVTFKLQYRHGEETAEPVYIPAVRSFLLARSPVFFSMFSGALVNKEDQENIYVNDVEPEAFHQLLRFIYTDQVQITAHNVMAVLNASKKYIVTNLTKKCVQFLEENISAATAASLLEQAIFFDEQELKHKILIKIEEEASSVLLSEDFVSLSTQAIREVLQLELKVKKELEVFEASMRWAEKKCQQMNNEINGLNKRDVLGDNLFLIRFPTMSVDDMNDTVLQHDVLSPVEALQLMRYITAKSTAKPQHIPFSSVLRAQNLEPQTITIPPPYVQVSSKQFTNQLHFNISKPILIKRILIHGNASLYDTVKFEQVVLYQNGRTEFDYTKKNENVQQSSWGNAVTRFFNPSDALPVVEMYAGMPCYAVAVNDVLLRPGAQVHLDIVLNTRSSISIQASPSTRQVSDDYVTINFVRCDGYNLLYGIEYSPADRKNHRKKRSTRNM